MSLPGRHSLLWRLAGILGLFCLLLISLHADMGRLLNQVTSYLSPASQQALRDYAAQAEQHLREEGASGLDRFLAELREREQVWAVAVDEHGHSLGSQALDQQEQQRLSFVRMLDYPVGRPGGVPTFYVLFSDGQSRLVLELPAHLNPRKYNALWELLLRGGLPALLAVALALLLYRVLIGPLATLRRQAVRLSAGDLSARVGPQLTARRDELGELASTFDHMAGRLQGMLTFQRQLLRDLSHELRTPLSRLRVAGDSEQDGEALRQRLGREVEEMDRLIGDALELVWLDTERPLLEQEDVDVARLWDVLRENASYESGWPVERMPCELPADCRLRGNLNGLARALENILRNALRHSPEGGVVRLGGKRDGARWNLWIEDQGPGVEAAELERIFQPFTRLNVSRPGGDGFGLGLAIARSMIELQGGRLWAENAEPGLRLRIELASV